MKAPHSTLLPILALVLFSAAGGVAAAQDMNALREQAGLLAIAEPTKILDFELEDLSGKKVKLSSLSGKVVVLNFWATWCPPCRAEIPSMQTLYGKLSKLGFEIVAVNLREKKSDVAAFAKSNKMTFPILLDVAGEVGGMYGVSAIPTSYVIDRKGFAVSGIEGSMEWDTPAVEKYLRALLAEKP